MSAQGLGSRAIIGEFFARLEQRTGIGWIDAISMLFISDQASEEYKWLGQSPVMREWVGGRNAKGFRENGITIINKHFEATLEVMVAEARRDKTGQVMVRVRELADRALTHWAKLLSTLIENGESTVCYDGEYFFDTDHSEGDSGTQDNDLSIDISALPVTNHGSITAPSVGEMQQVILQCVQAIQGFKDDQGEPLNETAQDFIVMTPTALFSSAAGALRLPMIDSGESNLLTNMPELRIRPVTNPRLTWTDKVAVFRTDGNVKPFIRQEEEPLDLNAVAEGSELEFNSKVWHFGVDTWREVGYGYWQHACLATMI